MTKRIFSLLVIVALSMPTVAQAQANQPILPPVQGDDEGLSIAEGAGCGAGLGALAGLCLFGPAGFVVGGTLGGLVGGAAAADLNCGFNPLCWISGALQLISLGMLFILGITSLLIQPLLTGPNFITNDLVKAGWPFVLGIANLGFVLALLFIAMLTILGLGGYNVRQALVRLLIAAILINFSLLIAGAILDVSRLLMALILRLVGGVDFNNRALGLTLVMSSQLFQDVFGIITEANNKLKLNPDASAFAVLKAMWLIAGTTLIFVILTISLLSRWLILIGLLIISPLAYLAMATPKMEHRAEQWWKMFLTYVFYGPVVAFILAIAVRGGNIAGDYIARLAGSTTKEGGDPYGLFGLMTLILTLGLMFLATQAGKFLGLAGALGMTSFVKNAVGGGVGFAKRHPVATGAILGGGVGGIAGYLAAKGAGTAKEAAMAPIEKRRELLKKARTGTATEKDLEELQKRPLTKFAAKVTEWFPGGGGNWMPGAGQVHERDAKIKAANTAVDQGNWASTSLKARNLVDIVPGLSEASMKKILDPASGASPETKLAVARNQRAINKFDDKPANEAWLQSEILGKDTTPIAIDEDAIRQQVKTDIEAMPMADVKVSLTSAGINLTNLGDEIDKKIKRTGVLPSSAQVDDGMRQKLIEIEQPKKLQPAQAAANKQNAELANLDTLKRELLETKRRTATASGKKA